MSGYPAAVPLRVCVAGVTGWTGSAVAEAVEGADDLELVAGVSRSDPASLSAADYEELDARARQQQVGVIAAGNFSLTAALLLRFATEAAHHLRSWEVIDYASLGKPDAPSGTAQELAERLEAVASPIVGVPVEETLGAREARGATVGATQVHSLRLPSFSVSTEIVFGGEDERLSIRHDAGSTPAPYVAGTLLAIRAVPGRVGVTRGLDQLF